MSRDSEFSHHEPCPKCGSRDNLGVWKDGHKYCFGCGYWDSGEQSVLLLKEKLMNATTETINGNSSSIDTSNYIYTLPKEVMQWLKKYQITDKEIKEYRLAWNTTTSSLVLPIYSTDGTLLVTNERYYGHNEKHPKYITRGSKGKQFLIVDKHKTDTVILVEDYISCIKVGRQYPCVALFGSEVPIKLVLSLYKRYKRAKVWLDMDKAVKSCQEASRASQWLPSSSIFTLKDPKEYSDEEIKRFIEN